MNKSIKNSNINILQDFILIIIANVLVGLVITVGIKFMKISGENSFDFNVLEDFMIFSLTFSLIVFFAHLVYRIYQMNILETDDIDELENVNNNVIETNDKKIITSNNTNVLFAPVKESNKPIEELNSQNTNSSIDKNNNIMDEIERQNIINQEINNQSNQNNENNEVDDIMRNIESLESNYYSDNSYMW